MQQVSVPLQHVNVCMLFLWQLQPFLSFLVLLHHIHHILQNTCRLCSFGLLCFALFCFFLFFFLWSGLFCCVLVPCTLALPFLCLDGLRLVFGLLCVTVYDHKIIIYISLG